MLSIRVVTAGALLVMAVAGAQAQTSTDTAPSKPFSLWQLLTPSAQPATPVAAPETAPETAPPPQIADRTAVRRPLRRTRRYARRRRHPAAEAEHPIAAVDEHPVAAEAEHPAAAEAEHQAAAGAERPVAGGGELPTPLSAQAAIDAVPASVWPVGDASSPEAAPTTAEPIPEAASAEPSLSEIVAGGRTVQVAAPDQLNDIDRAADDPDGASQMQNAIAASETTPDTVAALAQQDDSEILGQSWIAELLATIGGALTAGSVAWFLIGSAPQRRYD